MTELKIDDTQTNDNIIATLDTTTILQRNTNSLQTNMNLKRVTYYHTAPESNLLECSDKIHPNCITQQSIKSLINLNVNFNDIPIDYSKQKTENSNSKSLYSLSEKIPQLDINFSRIDPFCHEIHKIYASINSNDNTNTAIRFISYRHNLRAIAHIALFKLINFRMYDKCGLNVGIWRHGTDIMLENISEHDEELSLNTNTSPNFMYGFLLEHVLKLLSENKSVKKMEPMIVGLQRDEIRALNELQIGDIKMLVAAEMDAIMNGKVIEIKCCKIQTKKYWRKQSQIPDIADFKLLKYWTQCKFGGVDAVVIVFHEKGIVKKTKILNTEYIEKMFPRITNKCIKIVHDTLKWIKNIVMKLPEYSLYVLSFDTNNKRNSKFVLKNLVAKDTEKAVFDMLSNKEKNESNKLLKHGLVINPHTKQIELRTIL
eukprot:501722_1